MYSLPEQGVNRDDVILFRKRFYASDHAVNEQDPAQLHIIYVECRDAIVGNIYPVTKDKVGLPKGLCRLLIACPKHPPPTVNNGIPHPTPPHPPTRQPRTRRSRWQRCSAR